MSLTRAAILDVKDWKSVEVEVPEWGGPVWVRTMGTADMEAYMTMVGQRGADKDIRGLQVSLVAATVCDEHGTLLFTAEDVAPLGAKSWAAIGRVCAVAQELNLMREGALEAAKGE